MAYSSSLGAPMAHHHALYGNIAELEMEIQRNRNAVDLCDDYV